MGITHHSNYIKWAEEARVNFLEKIGWPFQRLEHLGLASPVLSFDIQYIHATTFSDNVEIHVHLTGFSIAKFKVLYEMFCNGRCVCKASSMHGLVGLDGKPMRLNEKFPDFYNDMLAQVENKS